jgi:hypothetical protein
MNENDVDARRVSTERAEWERESVSVYRRKLAPFRSTMTMTPMFEVVSPTKVLSFKSHECTRFEASALAQGRKKRGEGGE